MSKLKTTETPSMAPASIVVAAAGKIEKQMGGDHIKANYELQTNFPNDVTEVEYNVKNTDNGVTFKVYQNGDGTNLKTIEKNRTKDSDTLHVDTIKERSNGGSMFGIGTSNMDYYWNDYTFYCRIDDSDMFEKWVVSTGFTDVVKLNVDSKWKVIQEFTIPYDANETAEDKIKILKTISGLTDSKAIIGGRVHKFIVSGFDKLVNEELSGEVEPIDIIWQTKDASGRPKPEFTTLFDKSKTPLSEITLSSPGYSGISKSITFKVTGFGKRSKNNDLFFGINDVSDIPYMIIRLKENKQLLGRIALRGRSGKLHLNGVMLEVEVSKKELRNFYISPDKYKGFRPTFEADIRTKFVPLIENTYEDTNTKERSLQTFLDDVLVNSSYGGDVYEKDAHAHRKIFGVEFLSKLSVEKRREYVTPEPWSNKQDRLDIKIRYPKELSGLNEDTYTIIECKRENFNKNDIDQGFIYSYSTTGCVALYGVSVNISDSNVESFGNRKKAINESRQRRLGDISGELVDLMDNGFKYPSYEDYYRQLVYQRQEQEGLNIKSKKTK